MKKVAIFIPAFNEERSIGSLVLMARKYGKVYVVDDGSTDQTAEIAREAGAHVISHKQNGGYGAALKTIWKIAMKTDADAIVIIDGDYQHNPLDIPSLAAPVLENKADVCIGSRFLGKFVNPPPARRIGVSALNFLAKLSAKGKSFDYQSGFRAFRKEVLGKISFQNNGYPACHEVIVSAVKAGLRVLEVPVSVRYYEREELPILRGAGIAGALVKHMAHNNPLLFFGGLGVALLAASAFFGLFVLERFYSAGVLPIGSAFLTLFAGVGGLIVLLIAINLYVLDILESRGEDNAP
ncbi:MAG: glycosyltransferase family 2 protein [Candidatus Anstonellaceae archaeon]